MEIPEDDATLHVLVIGSIHNRSKNNKNMKFCIIICGLLYFVQGMEIPEDLREEERRAFALCDSDRMMGLTWKEVEKCEARYADLLAEQDIPILSKEDFDAADLNEDGTLMFEEWEEWVQEQQEEQDEEQEDEEDEDESDEEDEDEEDEEDEDESEEEEAASTEDTSEEV